MKYFIPLLFGLGMFCSVPACLGFSDIQESAPFREAILYLKNTNIIQGYSDNTYRPDEKINRYDFTKIVLGVRFSSEEIDVCDVKKYFFSDVAWGQWFTPYICAAKKNAIVQGYRDGTFRGQQNITLSEAIKVVLESYGEDILPESQGPWHVPYMLVAKEKGLLTSLSKDPQHLLSRGEMAQIIFQMETKGISYPWHTNITATVFWVGEGIGNGSSEDNALSAFDDEWQKHYGCFDDPFSRDGFYPKGCTPKENPFYLDLPYYEFDWEGTGGRKESALQYIPWADEKEWEPNESLMKNRWVRIRHKEEVCYGQIEDAGPYEYDDVKYVFGENDQRPKTELANNAGLDVSPALRDCLGFVGLNNAENVVDWQFVDEKNVPDGPWKEIVTTSGTHWK
jgi:hypothetical protein